MVYLGQKTRLKSLSLTVNPVLPSPPLNHVPKGHFYTSFKYLQAIPCPAGHTIADTEA